MNPMESEILRDTKYKHWELGELLLVVTPVKFWRKLNGGVNLINQNLVRVQ